MQAIKCHPDTIIYIFCPAGFATGGPEALHQLGYHLKQLRFNAFMYYYQIPESVGMVHESYSLYNVPYVTQLKNESKHVMIVPESYLLPLFKKEYNLVRKAVWWLSVGFYYKTQKRNIDAAEPRRFFGLENLLWGRKKAPFSRLRQHQIFHIAHSYYSLIHLKEKGIEPVGQISDYMNDAFFLSANGNVKKEDMVIYNPRKNDEFLQQIISQTPDINWVPLVNMTPQQVAEWMNKAKVYVDFGYHPGKERMPREACIMRCCLIIGKAGSAAFQKDMPIPEKYRFKKESSEVPQIIARIKECLTAYNRVIDDFKPYQQDLDREKEKFVANVRQVFAKV